MAQIDRLNELIIYDRLTGEFTSRVSRPGVRLGAKLGTIRKSNGYLQICIDRKLYYAHRLAMIICGNNVEDGQVDHIDGNKLNNRESNLRVSKGFENIQNIKAAYITNKIGVLGVSRSRNGKSYTARIFSDNKHIYLGSFGTVEEASAAYISAKRALHAFNTL